MEVETQENAGPIWRNPVMAISVFTAATIALCVNSLVDAWDKPLLRAALLEVLRPTFAIFLTSIVATLVHEYGVKAKNAWLRRMAKRVPITFGIVAVTFFLLIGGLFSGAMSIQPDRANRAARIWQCRVDAFDKTLERPGTQPQFTEECVQLFAETKWYIPFSR